MQKNTKILYIFGHLVSLISIIVFLAMTIVSKTNQVNIESVPQEFLNQNPGTTLDQYKEYLGLAFIIFLILTCYFFLMLTLAFIETTNKEPRNRTLYMILVGCFSMNILYIIGGLTEYKKKERK